MKVWSELDDSVTTWDEFVDANSDWFNDDPEAKEEIFTALTTTGEYVVSLGDGGTTLLKRVD